MHDEEQEYRETVDRIAKKGKKFKADAYNFVIVALAALQRQKAQEHILDTDIPRIDHNEGLHWIKIYGFFVYGMLAKNVFNDWGLKKSEDFIEIIDALVSNKLIHRQHIQKRYSDSYVKAGFDFSDYAKQDFLDVFFGL